MASVIDPVTKQTISDGTTTAQDLSSQGVNTTNNTPPITISATTPPSVNTQIASAVNNPITPALPTGVTTERANAMLTNLNEGWNNKRNVFDSRESYNNAYGYAGKSQGEQSILDAYYTKRMGGMDNANSSTTPQIQTITNQNIQPTSVDKANSAEVANANAQNAEVNSAYNQAQTDNTAMQQDLATQSENGISNAQQYAQDATALAQTQQQQTQAVEAQRQAEENRKLQEQLTIMQPLQQKEREQQQAELASLKADDTAEVENLKIQQDAIFQSTMINLGSLGGSVSTAGINGAAQIYLVGQRAISSMKLKNKSNEATLAKSIAETEYTHQKEINDIVSSSKDKIIDSQAKVSQSIIDCQKNILLTNKEKNDKIDTILTNWRADKKILQDDLYAKMKDKNTQLTSNLQRITALQTTMEASQNTKIADMVTSGRWSSLSPQAQAQYAAQSGMDLATIQAKQQGMVSTAIRTAFDNFIGKDFIIPNADMATLYSAIQDKMKLGGYTLDRAISEVVGPYIQNNPQYKKMQELKMEQASLTINKAKAEIANTNADTTLKGAQANAQNADAAAKKATEADAKLIKGNDANGNPFVKNPDTGVITTYTNDPETGALVETTSQGTPINNKGTSTNNITSTTPTVVNTSPTTEIPSKKFTGSVIDGTAKVDISAAANDYYNLSPSNQVKYLKQYSGKQSEEIQEQGQKIGKEETLKELMNIGNWNGYERYINGNTSGMKVEDKAKYAKYDKYFDSGEFYGKRAEAASYGIQSASQQNLYARAMITGDPETAWNMVKNTPQGKVETYEKIGMDALNTLNNGGTVQIGTREVKGEGVLPGTMESYSTGTPINEKDIPSLLTNVYIGLKGGQDSKLYSTFQDKLNFYKENVTLPEGYEWKDGSVVKTGLITNTVVWTLPLK